MSHHEFARRYAAGALPLSVDRSLALRVINHSMLPRRYTVAHYVRSWGWLLTALALTAAAVHFRSWAALALLAALTPAMHAAVRRAACREMIEHALEDEAFYRVAVECGVLRFADTSPERALAAPARLG